MFSVGLPVKRWLWPSTGDGDGRYGHDSRWCIMTILSCTWGLLAACLPARTGQVQIIQGPEPDPVYFWHSLSSSSGCTNGTALLYLAESIHLLASVECCCLLTSCNMTTFIFTDLTVYHEIMSHLTSLYCHLNIDMLHTFVVLTVYIALQCFCKSITLIAIA